MVYNDCPILGASRLQSAFDLSIMESKYVALSTDWRDVILVMHLLKEMQDQGCDVENTLSTKCQLFEDNSGILEQESTKNASHKHCLATFSF
jgi:hypothetical protein